MEFIVDSREGKLIDFLSSKSVSFTQKQLDIGDFQFHVDGKPQLIIERKTYSDLASSIHGGRYHEQKARLHAQPCNMKAYLIEGPYPNASASSCKFLPVPAATLDSAILGTAFRDGFIMMYSQSVEHSAELLIKLQQKLPEYLKQKSDRGVADGEPTEYASLIKTVKKDNLTVETCYLSQLAQIPGLSVNMATVIAKEWNSMWKLLSDINTKPETEKKLAGLQVGARKLGPVLASRMMTYLGNLQR